ncbi:MAG: putative zinc-binding protein [Phycisphaerae bacterium]|jgi:uncharacterized metal-binding protein
MGNAKSCECSAGPTLIFACSGAADVGELSDLAARKLNKEGVGKMFCLAGVGGRVAGIMGNTKGAARLLAIDGCGLDCARLTLEQAGICDFAHMRVTDLGMAKGETPVTTGNVTRVADEAAATLMTSPGRKA